MGKKQRLDNLDQLLEQRDAQRAAAEQFELKVRSECSHKKTSNDGRIKLSVTQLDKFGNVECKRCGDVFNIERIPVQGDKYSLSQSLSTVHNAIQQIRCFSDVRNEKDRKLSVELGSVDAVLTRLPQVYIRTLDAYTTGKKKNKKNKNKKKQQSGFGSYSSQLNSRYNG